MIYEKSLHCKTQNHGFHWFHGANKAKKKIKTFKSMNGHKVVLIKTLCPRYRLKVFYKNTATGPYIHLWT